MPIKKKNENGCETAMMAIYLVSDALVPHCNFDFA